MRILQAAETLHTTAKAIRFYEKEGLLTPEKDITNGYRNFNEKNLLRLSTILALREIDVPVADIKKLLENDDMDMNQYLNIQRSALFERWLAIKDMIQTIDQMVKRTEGKDFQMQDIHELAKQLKHIKTKRTEWQDRWNFNDQADDYDDNIKMQGYRFNVHQDYDKALQMVTDYVQMKTNDTCLDIGIGTGNLGAKFLQKGVHVIGVDQAENMLEACKQKHPEIEVRKGHFLALPVLDQQVNAVVSSYALHHLPDAEKLLAFVEMDRVLKTGGQICIADLMFENGRHRKKVLEAFQEAGNELAVDAIEDEYYADRSILEDWLTKHRYHVAAITINDILSVIHAVKQPAL
ncbi:methyltransferase domain-containing protein [Virgibacillus halophilus]|uniref:Methyltransferase domain-containing protein n=1 Tax=Tigheibacillus halophilus TaxID=361280 RepID=A0ABU5C686_9BACI|nr:methyltransferase domain-containing protein [Virgibacillus halophilus]